MTTRNIKHDGGEGGGANSFMDEGQYCESNKSVPPQIEVHTISNMHNRSYFEPKKRKKGNGIIHQ